MSCSNESLASLIRIQKHRNIVSMYTSTTVIDFSPTRVHGLPKVATLEVTDIFITVA